MNMNVIDRLHVNFIGNIAYAIKEIRHFFSRRQIKIIIMKLRGYKNIEIAKKLGISPATVTLEIQRIERTFLEDPELREYIS